MAAVKGSRKVVFFSDAPYTGGAEKYLYLLASNLDRSRYEPEVVMCIPEKPGSFREWLERDGIPVHEIGWNAVFSISGARRFARIIKYLSPDIVHINLPGPFDAKYGLAAPLAQYAGAVKIVSTEHLPMIRSFPKAKMIRSFSGRFIDRVITVSEDNRKHLEKGHGVSGGKIRVVYNGIPDPAGAGRAGFEGASERTPGGMEIVMVGALEERKGHRLMIDALAGLPENVSLSIIGEGELASTLASLAADMGVGNRVRFQGYRADIAAILSKSDLLVLPSMLDATPYVIIEALASGLPVVASGIFGIKELVMDGETGFLTIPGDREDLIKAVYTLYADPDLRKRMSVACRLDFLKRFTIERSVLATMNVYDELFEARRPHRGTK